MKICLDMDSVLADIAPVECQIIEEITGKRIGKIHIKDWDVLEYFGIDKKISYLKFWEEVWNRWTDIHPEEEYIGGKVGELMVLGQVDVVTASKGYTSEENRKKWLAKYHIPYSQFMATPYGEDKLSLDYNIWIDDSPHNAEAAIRANKSLLLYTQPWNVHVMEEGKVKRIFSLSDARRLLLENNK